MRDSVWGFRDSVCVLGCLFGVVLGACFSNGELRFSFAVSSKFSHISL